MKKTPSFDALSREVALRCKATGEVTFADARAERRLGTKVGASLFDLCPADLSSKIKDLLRAAAESDEPVSSEVPLNSQGKLETFTFEAMRCPDEKGEILLVGTLLARIYANALDQVNETVAEISELQRHAERQRKELDAQNQELRRLTAELTDSNSGVISLHTELVQKAGDLQRQGHLNDRLVSSVSHEFRTPLHSIMGLTQLLVDGADGALNEEQEKQVRFIRSSAEELIQLVNDMLDLSRVDAGQAALRAERFSLNEFLQTQRGALRPLVPVHGKVELVFDEPAVDVVLETDRTKLAQITRNLISNALKFTDEGSVRVEVKHDDRQLVLKVRDTGIGIAPEDQDRVFEEFSQVESVQEARPKGTGLGLPIARSLSHFLGGNLEMESEVGRGTTFTLTVPLVHGEVKEMREVSARSKTLDAGRAPVLVVEDDRKTIFIYERYLTMAGFQALPARTISEAREQLKRVRPAAVVLDIMLEGEATWEFLAELKKNPETADIPVLVVTVTNREQKARALGADEFWFKPVDPERLLKKLKAVSRPKHDTTVLVIDDDPKALYLMEKHLQGTPFKAITASSGAEGIVLAQKKAPDVILLDFLLENVTAFDVMDELKADPRTRPIPVIIVTSHALDAAERGRLLQEADAVISKQHLSRELAINRIRDALHKAGVGMATKK